MKVTFQAEMSFPKETTVPLEMSCQRFDPLYSDPVDILLQYSILIISIILSLREARSRALIWPFLMTLAFWSSFQISLCACVLPSLPSQQSNETISCNGISIIWAALMGFGFIISRPFFTTTTTLQPLPLNRGRLMWIALFLVGNAISIRFILQDYLTLVSHLCAFVGGCMTRLFIRLPATPLSHPSTSPSPESASPATTVESDHDSEEDIDRRLLPESKSASGNHDQNRKRPLGMRSPPPPPNCWSSSPVICPTSWLDLFCRVCPSNPNLHPLSQPHLTCRLTDSKLALSYFLQISNLLVPEVFFGPWIGGGGQETLKDV